MAANTPPHQRCAKLTEGAAKAPDALREWQAAPEIDMAQRAQSGLPPPGPTVADPSLCEAAEKARKAADDADDVLIEIIREGLQGKGQPLGQWPPKASDRTNQESGLTSGPLS